MTAATTPQAVRAARPVRAFRRRRAALGAGARRWRPWSRSGWASPAPGPVAPGQDRLGPLRRRPALEQGRLADRPDRLADRAGARGRRAGDGAGRAGRERRGAIGRARQAARRGAAAARPAAGRVRATRSSSSTSGWSRSTRATPLTTLTVLLNSNGFDDLSTRADYLNALHDADMRDRRPGRLAARSGGRSTSTRSPT